MKLPRSSGLRGKKRDANRGLKWRERKGKSSRKVGGRREFDQREEPLLGSAVEGSRESQEGQLNRRREPTDEKTWEKRPSSG